MVPKRSYAIQGTLADLTESLLRALGSQRYHIAGNTFVMGGNKYSIALEVEGRNLRELDSIELLATRVTLHFYRFTEPEADEFVKQFLPLLVSA